MSRDLSQEAQELCEGHPVFMLEPMQDSISVPGGCGKSQSTSNNSLGLVVMSLLRHMFSVVKVM